MQLCYAPNAIGPRFEITDVKIVSQLFCSVCLFSFFSCLSLKMRLHLSARLGQPSHQNLAERTPARQQAAACRQSSPACLKKVAKQKKYRQHYFTPPSTYIAKRIWPPILIDSKIFSRTRVGIIPDILRLKRKIPFEG